MELSIEIVAHRANVPRLFIGSNTWREAISGSPGEKVLFPSNEAAPAAAQQYRLRSNTGNLPFPQIIRAHAYYIS